uniref:Uncharacterized protein n=1 Tax=Timema tahoe TaxID=61484 RepID=A0A7R9NZ82_9NEOP|nr:unnamed protein product [Timema tahoe]
MSDMHLTYEAWVIFEYIRNISQILRLRQITDGLTNEVFPPTPFPHLLRVALGEWWVAVKLC